jgi:hypothetical protein
VIFDTVSPSVELITFESDGKITNGQKLKICKEVMVIYLKLLSCNSSLEPGENCGNLVTAASLEVHIDLRS